MSKQPPFVTRVNMLGIVVNNYMALRSAVLTGAPVIIITRNLSITRARRIAREEYEALISS